jgi:DNA end-binding protein Ku
MPRSIWNGTIAFGAVAVPIKLYSAMEDRTVHFHEVHQADGARIEHRPFCSKEDKEVSRDEIVKGYEVRKGKYVVVEKEEIDAASGTRSRIIDVDRFVCAADIDPVFYDKSYFVGARDEGADAYRLLHDALARTDRAAIGRFTFHNREYLAAIRPFDDVMVLHTMRFADELVAPKDLDVPKLPGKAKPAEVKMAQQLIASLHAPFNADRWHDEYRELVLEAIGRRAEGEPIAEPEEPEPEPEGDLLDVLQASVKASRGKRGRRSKTTKKSTSKPKAKA